jgi:hypothetical protein
VNIYIFLDWMVFVFCEGLWYCIKCSRYLVGMDFFACFIRFDNLSVYCNFVRYCTIIEIFDSMFCSIIGLFVLYLCSYLNFKWSVIDNFCIICVLLCFAVLNLQWFGALVTLCFVFYFKHVFVSILLYFNLFDLGLHSAFCFFLIVFTFCFA